MIYEKKNSGLWFTSKIMLQIAQVCYLALHR